MAEAGVDNITFLEEAKAAVIQMRRAQAVTDEQELQAKRLEKALFSEKKAVADSIEMTIRKRKAEITDSYDSQIEELQGHLRKVKNKREKAKNEGMKERIAGETADLIEENRRLNTEIKTVFRQDRVPGFCNSLFFYSLYYTKGIKEILVFILTLAVCFFGVPVGIYQLIGVDSTIVLILLYLVDIFCFGGLYFFLNNQIKVRHLDALKKGRENRNAVAANKKKIKAIKNAIKKDKNEEMYGLEKFDREIQKLEQDKVDIANQKQEALTNFENSGKVLITQEITENNQERISQLESDYNHSSEQLAEYRDRQRKTAMILAERFEPLLGKEFMQEEKLDALIQAISSGQAANITEAQELVRAGTPIGIVEPPAEPAPKTEILTAVEEEQKVEAFVPKQEQAEEPEAK